MILHNLTTTTWYNSQQKLLIIAALLPLRQEVSIVPVLFSEPDVCLGIDYFNHGPEFISSKAA